MMTLMCVNDSTSYVISWFIKYNNVCFNLLYVCLLSVLLPSKPRCKRWTKLELLIFLKMILEWTYGYVCKEWFLMDFYVVYFVALLAAKSGLKDFRLLCGKFVIWFIFTKLLLSQNFFKNICWKSPSKLSIKYFKHPRQQFSFNQ